MTNETKDTQKPSYVDEAYRTKILEDARDARIKEITEYQVNVDNFRLAIQKVEGVEGLQLFKKTLEGNLQDYTVEQKKSIVILEVIMDQLEARNARTV